MGVNNDYSKSTYMGESGGDKIGMEREGKGERGEKRERMGEERETRRETWRKEHQI